MPSTIRLHRVFKTTPEKARAQWAASLHNIKAILEDDAASV